MVIKDTVAIAPKVIKATQSLLNTASSAPLYRFYVSLPCVLLTEAGIWKSQIIAKVGEDIGIVKEACANCFPCGGTIAYSHPDVIPDTLEFQIFVDGIGATFRPQSPPANKTFDILYKEKVIGQLALLSVGPLTITVYPKGATIYVDPRVTPQPPFYLIERHTLPEFHPLIQWHPSNVIDVEALLPQITDEGLVVKAGATAKLKYAFAEDFTEVHFETIAPTSLAVYSTGVYQKQPIYLYAEAYDQRGEYYELAMDEPMRITIDSAQYGNLYSISGQSGSSIVVPYQELYDFNVWFQVEGQPIVRPTPITATISMERKPSVKGTTTFTYEPEIHHLVVRSVPKKIAHNEHARIFVQAQDVDSNDVEFPWTDVPVRLFYNDTTYGRLKPDEIVSVIAASSVPASTKQHIQQKSVDTVLRDGVRKRLIQRHPELQRQMLTTPEKKVLSSNVSLMHNVGPLFLETTYADVNAGKIIYEASGETPTTDQMIDLTAIQYFTGSIGGVPQYFEGYSGTGTVVVKGEEQQPELEVIEPKANDKTRKEITNEPKMPEIVAKARLKNYTGGTVTFNWKLTVQWENTENYGASKRLITETFTGTTTANNSEVSEWNVDWKNKTRGGKDVTLEVTATAGGKTYSSGVIDKPYEILGMNPTPAMVKEGLTIEEQVIVYMESKPKWKHFKKDFDFPIFGNPFGYGLMQLDNPRSTDEQVWNWKANKAAGKALFKEKKNGARTYSKRIKNGNTWYWKDKKKTERVYNDPIKPHWDWYSQPYSQVTTLSEGEELLKETFQRYNGGVYWRWRPYFPWLGSASPGKWKKTTTSDYGDKAWGIYSAIVNQNKYPEGWN